MNFKSFFTHFGLLLIFLVIFGVALSLGFQPSTEMLILFIVGFSAQLIDGALGMGFGMISTASLLGFGMNPAIISSSVHAAEIFSSAASGISHHRNGNVNKKLFLSLLIPGMIGAIVGASLLVIASDFNLELLKIIIACYTMLLGARLIYLFIKRQSKNGLQYLRSNNPKIKPLALVGGFLDSFGGGGWGPVVTSTLVGNGHEPRYAIGSVNSAEFFIALASSATFFIALGTQNWAIIIALVCGGVTAAPIAAKITKKTTASALLLLVGVLVIIWSFYTILKIVL